MKKLNKIMGPAFVTIILFSCTENDDRVAESLFQNKSYLLQEFNKKSIIGRENKFYQLSYHKNQYINSFFFENIDDKLILVRDTLQFPIREISAFSSMIDIDSSGVSRELKRLIKVMKDNKVDNVSSEFASSGIDLKIYFGDHKALLYVTDVNSVKNVRWKEYIKSGKKLDENWYFVKDELN